MSRTWIELDLDTLAENIRAAMEAAGRAEILMVVKSNAYNHGLAPVSKEAWRCGVRTFVVGTVEEAVALKGTVPGAKVLFVGSAVAESAREIVQSGIVPVLYSEPQARAISEAAVTAGTRVECHVKIDTGMGRMGFQWEKAGPALETLAAMRGLRITGICTHFASGPSDGAFAAEQAERFRKVVAEAARHGLRNLFRHASNSTVFCDEGAWDFEGVRPGILLYGYGRQGARKIVTKPFLQWKSRLVQVKEVPSGFPVSYDSTYRAPRRTRLGTVDAGYADGFSRMLSNKGFMLVGGRRCPVAGRVTMNYTVLDLGPESSAREGDEVVIIGRQGGEEIWADEMAAWRGTIPYEVLTNILTGDRRVTASRTPRLPHQTQC